MPNAEHSFLLNFQKVTPVPDAPADRLRHSATDRLKARFVGRDEVIDLIALAVVAGEHLFLFGPPGTAKSLLVREFAGAVHCRYFEYLLTRFSEPTELFGPVDLARLREGVVATVTTGMLPEAEFAFLDELFNANSAILNNLLTVLNERVYRRGAETHRLPLLSAFAASNHLPEDDALQALFDRFLLRCKVDALPRTQLPALLAAGWAIERNGKPTADRSDALTADDLHAMGQFVKDVVLEPILETYADAVEKVRDLGVTLSDRRAVKVLKLVAASAVMCGRATANVSDLWVLRYVWDRVEQIGPLGSLVSGILDHASKADAPHPRAAQPEAVDVEALAAELTEAERELALGPKLVEIARLRERVQAVADRASWATDATGRGHLLTQAGALLKRLG
ncbi:atpase : MoxR-like ATPase OS=Singulisphaera acidiphila (strain ATCC BAA-1392 / DSM 18658 / VKM B-2454 / MOB10) GN=Sinac_2120 PE=4 SV=1: AAA_5 [Gemmata massiliana]|uniref:AAA+ ATPase domain-containing protein n=1 Tax=Gemmata massiliana TaxID=1210884 RepID=A0A6P2D2D4_9BACT|nr:AAA family ATPase [Gemmata massiliana]VTR95017.1 atpase : MoxR-like ATPase OS=Singulisphaera acidiphila (strain ATCC BAA-1392 / DSM 18658 / VKM B-2454 / MOB10) GN=Sinac_2120 PE=4 SV=1: AAA_5 [Gemmata massiliana]